VVRFTPNNRSGTAVIVIASHYCRLRKSRNVSWTAEGGIFLRYTKYMSKLSEKDKKLFAMRHSAEHVLTQAMINLYPKLKMAMGPATDDGFYFDFDNKDKIAESDFPKIEAEMRKIIDLNLPIKREVVNVKKARGLFKGNEYKEEWIDEIEESKKKAVLYWTGDKFVDLCSGPHINSTGDIKAFKLLSVAGAYWRGTEKNKMLTRIYGTAFQSKKELEEYLKNLEEAKKRDHRKIGKELELFMFSDKVGPGLPLWLPQGTIIKDELEKFGKETETKNGYQRVSTPHLAKEILYKTSGHLPYYADDMYPPMEYEGENYYVKPMNCPHMHMIYNFRTRSYKELPIRYAEFGTVYRHEDSGTLMGIMRVRGHTTNDAHIYCTEKQALEELVGVLNLHSYYYKILGIKEFHVELSLPDFDKKGEKYFDNPQAWKKSTELLRSAAKKAGIETVEKKGTAAFYGPKFDFIVKSAIGRSFGTSTNQLDFGSGKRFKLEYVDKSGDKKIIPYIIHRAPLGSHERFIGFLIEHFGGEFPVWLSPVQAKILPVSKKHLKYADSVKVELEKAGVRVELDSRDETLGGKIRDAQLAKVPFMLIVGDREKVAKKVAIRLRNGKDLGQQSLSRFIETITLNIDSKSLTL